MSGPEPCVNRDCAHYPGIHSGMCVPKRIYPREITMQQFREIVGYGNVTFDEMRGAGTSKWVSPDGHVLEANTALMNANINKLREMGWTPMTTNQRNPEYVFARARKAINTNNHHGVIAHADAITILNDIQDTLFPTPTVTDEPAPGLDYPQGESPDSYVHGDDDPVVHALNLNGGYNLQVEFRDSGKVTWKENQ